MDRLNVIHASAIGLGAGAIAALLFPAVLLRGLGVPDASLAVLGVVRLAGVLLLALASVLWSARFWLLSSLGASTLRTLAVIYAHRRGDAARAADVGGPPAREHDPDHVPVDHRVRVLHDGKAILEAVRRSHLGALGLVAMHRRVVHAQRLDHPRTRPLDSRRGLRWGDACHVDDMVIRQRACMDRHPLLLPSHAVTGR